MANNCIFCGEPAGSREHIWPKWILARKNFGQFRLKRAGQPDAILKNSEHTTKMVCHDCNTGWMSRLEGRVKPILEPMFDGHAISLDVPRQHLLAKWLMKMAFLWDSTKGRDADNAFYQLGDGVALATKSELPVFTNIWIGTVDEKHRSADGMDFTLNDPPELVGGANCVTLMNEHFAAQVVSLRLGKQPSGKTVLQLKPRPGDWNNTLISIWPIDPPLRVLWPPRFAMSPLGYLQLMDRWRTGDYVDKIVHP